MTCIVGLVHDDGSVWLGGDAAASTSHTVWVRKDSKVFVQGELILGFTGSYRSRDVLQYQTSMQQPKPGEDVDRFMRTVFIDEVRGVFSRNGYLSKDDGKDQQHSRLLVGVRGRLFMVDSDFHVGEMETPFAAIGSGYSEAQGSLYSTRNVGEPQARLTEALNASSYYNPGVRPPFNFVRTLPWPSPKA